jgi:hypothetical protein
MEEDGEVFYFSSAPAVEQFSGVSNLDVPLLPKQEKTKKKYGRLRDDFNVEYSALPSLLYQLFNDHKQSGKLMTWEEVNQPRETGWKHKTKLAELNAHRALFRNCVKVGLPVPICPDIDGLSFDWTWQGKTIQAKVASRTEGIERYNVGNAVLSAYDTVHKRGKTVAASFGAHDFMYITFPKDTFALLPKELLRRHGAYNGQISVKKPTKISAVSRLKKRGRANFIMHTEDMNPKRGVAPQWQTMCAKYFLSWNSKTVKRDVNTILTTQY